MWVTLVGFDTIGPSGGCTSCECTIRHLAFFCDDNVTQRHIGSVASSQPTPRRDAQRGKQRRLKTSAATHQKGPKLLTSFSDAVLSKMCQCQRNEVERAVCIYKRKGLGLA